jgi:hypothetical protein
MSEAMMTHVFVVSKKLVKEKGMKIKKIGGKEKMQKRKSQSIERSHCNEMKVIKYIFASFLRKVGKRKKGVH